MDNLIAEIERRAAEAQKTPQGPNYIEIVEQVARENDTDPDLLHESWVDSWLMGAV